MSRVTGIKAVTFDLDGALWDDFGAEDGATKMASTYGHR
jgi:hypothetical protein